MYDISPDANSKPKKVAEGARATLEYIEDHVVSDNASDGVGARTALRAVLAQTALGWNTVPKSVGRAVSVIRKTMAVSGQGQVASMPERAILPASVIAKVGTSFCKDGR